jgi:DNA-binding response OmpR family regulator
MAKRIMVVNDTQEILDLFRLILEEEGYEAIPYSYAIQDMLEVERVQPDLMIIDLVFGREKVGWQMLQKLKMLRSTASIPVIVCTAATKEVYDMEGYLRSKSVTVVLKPFDVDDMLAAVKEALDSSDHPLSSTDHETRDED